MPWTLRGATLAALLAASLPFAASAAEPEARATLRDREGRTVGTVTLRNAPTGVLLRARMDSLPPGIHAIHVHERGVCEGDFESAGSHFAPSQHAHGLLSEKGPHAGDLPNLFVPEAGKLEVEMHAPALSLASGSALFDADGSAIVIHEAADDHRSDPAGGAGARIACGRIEASE